MKTRILASVLIVGGLFVTANKGYACGTGNSAPTAILTADPQYAVAGDSVTLDGSGSYDSDGSITKYEWDVDSNGTWDYTTYPPTDSVSHTYSSPGAYTAKLKVTDDDSATDTDTCKVYVRPSGNIIYVPDDLDTIQEAIDVAIDGNTIVVSTGTYYESINFKGKAITVRSTDPNDAGVVAETIIRDGFSFSVVTFNSSEGADSVLTGFTLTGYVYGVSCSNSSGPMITKCIIRDNSSCGVYSSSSSPPLIRNNCIYDNDKGIEFSSASSAATVQNNTIVDNTSYGIYVNSGTGPSIINCILWGNSDDLYDCSATYSCIEDGDSGTGNISSDPCFVDADANDFHLAEDSACINRGDPDGSYSGQTDIDGESRVMGGIVDMGADEVEVMLWFVDVNAPGDDGTSWEDAFNDLQDALDVADYGDGIWVAAGTYNLDEMETFNLVDGVGLYGGFPPGGGNWNDRNPNMYETILTGDCEVYKVVRASNVGETTIIDGFTISGGIDEGIKCENNGSPTIKNNKITGNKYCGIYCYSNSDAHITNCTIEDTTSGDAIYCGSSSDPHITNCIIKNNFEGGIYCNGGVPIIKNNFISGYGGKGIYLESTGEGAVIRNNTIVYVEGYGIHLSGGTEPPISNCIIRGEKPLYDNDYDVTYSCIEGETVYPGTGNINSDPCFVEAEANNYHLMPDSLCIDVGDGDYPGETDIDGQPRVIGDSVDMGADEYDPDDFPWREPKIIYVDKNASGGDGSSWANAFTDIQDALASALMGDEIWVASTDVNDPYVPGDGRDDSFQLKNTVALYGGFNGTETSRDQRDWTIYATVLSGNIGEEYDNDNCHNVVKGANRAVLDGFTITKGHGGGRGGGIYCYNVSPTIKNCTITDNASTDGGGMYNNLYSSPRIINCIFSENTASGGSYGGGMYNYKSSPLVVNCIFSENMSGNSGGMYNKSSSPSIINCTFVGNYANSYDGIHNYNGSSPTVTNCIFWGNDAVGSGVEIYNNTDVPPTFSYCVIEGGLNGDKCEGDDSNDGGGNIESDPCFADANNPAGPDGTFGTFDDGLRLTIDSNCVDAADGNTAFSTDIVGFERVDVAYVDNTGVGEPNYADIGAYELLIIWFVDVNAPPDGNGMSWDDAFDNLQDALSEANDSDEIWVAEGTYMPDANDPNNRSISFELVEGVGVYGGFDGSEILRYKRDWIANKTILSGDINEPDDSSDNSYHVVIGPDNAILDGFTITGGYADSPQTNAYPQAHGGGILCDGRSPKIKNCILIDNRAHQGGGLCNGYGADSIVTNCVFVENLAHDGGIDGDGGGMLNRSSSPEVTSCLFIDNVANNLGGGGGMRTIGSNASPIVTNCTFTGNDAGYGGAVETKYGSTTFANCIFWDNTADSQSWGHEILSSTDANITLAYCDIKGGWNGPGMATREGGEFVDGGGNIGDDPCFVDASDPRGPDGTFGTSDDGLQLDDSDNPNITEGHDVNSPCIDAGDNSAVPEPNNIQTDLTGARRIINGTVDIGVYESAGYEFYENCNEGYPINESTPKYVKVVINGMQLCEFGPYSSFPWYVQSSHELIIRQATAGIYSDPDALCDGTPCEWMHGSPFNEFLNIATYYKCCGDDEESRLRLWESAIASEVYNYFYSESTCSQTYFENDSLCYIEFAAYDGTAKVTWGPEINGKAYLDQLLASNPSPEDGATDVSINADLGWTAGYVIKSHDVYFGTDYSEVYGATDPNTAPGRGRQTDTTFDPGTMDYNTAYYWRIDEVDPQENTRTGYVWSFTTVAE